MEESIIIKIGIVISVVVVVVIISIISVSFATLEYYEYGFAKQKSTGKVDITTVYGHGKHFIGPDYEFKKLRADAHNVELEDIAAFTRDKLEVYVTVSYQYFLKKEDLPLLHEAYDIYYEDIIRNKGIDALKSAVTEFNKWELFRNRSEVETKLFNAIRQRIGGVCCPEGCKTKPYGCPPDCKTSKCTLKDKGSFADVRYFQLKSIYIPSSVRENWMKTLLEGELALKEEYIQEAQIVRKTTDQLVRNIQNQADEISEEAWAVSEAIRTESEANYINVIETARSQGLKSLYSSLNITQQGHKNSFDYLRTLRGLDHVHLTVDFQQLIAGNL